MTTKRDQTLRTGHRYHLPLPTGPYHNIGFIDILTGSDKSDGVLLRILYPSVDQNIDRKERAKEWANWFPHDNYRTGYMNVSNIYWMPAIKALNKLMSDVFIPVSENAEPLKSEDKTFPVIIFSHGLASCRTTYSSICYELVSYGFIVFVVEHRDQSACTSFFKRDDGLEWVQYKQIKLYKNDLEIRKQQLNERVGDIQRTMDLINDLQNGKQIENLLETQIDCQKFAKHFDLNNIVLMGHSFGSSTTLKALLSIDSIKLGICLDAWMYPIQELDPSVISKPILFINMQTFQFNKNLNLMKEYIGKDGKNTDKRRVYTVKGAKHTDQSDIPFVLNSAMLWIFKMKSKANPFVVHDLTTALTIDFIADHLKIALMKDKKGFIEEFGIHLTEGIDLNDCL